MLGSVKFFEPAMGGQIVEQSFRPLIVVQTITVLLPMSDYVPTGTCDVSHYSRGSGCLML